MSVRGSNRPVRELATLVPACDHSVVLWLLWQTYTMGRHPAAQQRKVVNALRRKSTVCVWRGRMRETVGGALNLSSLRWLCPSQTVQYSCGIGLRLLEKIDHTHLFPSTIIAWWWWRPWNQENKVNLHRNMWFLKSSWMAAIWFFKVYECQVSVTILKTFSKKLGR